jgi:hypothetical protein
MIVTFLPLTQNLKHNSGGCARPHNHFLVAPLLAFPLKKPRIVALYLLTTFRTLALVGAFWERLTFILKIR